MVVLIIDPVSQDENGVFCLFERLWTFMKEIFGAGE